MGPFDAARQALEAGRLGLAERGARAWLQAAPTDPAPRLLLAEVLEALGRPAEALQAWLDAAARAPQQADGWRGFGRLALSLGHVAEARQALDRAIAADPRDPELRRLAARAASRLKLLDAARIHLEALVALTPEDADAHFSLGALSWEQGRSRDAFVCWQATLDRDPTHRLALQLVAGVLLETHDEAGALAFARAGLKAWPDDLPLQRIAAAALSQQGQDEDARAAATRALGQHPDHPSLLWLRLAAMPHVCADAAHEARVCGTFEADLVALEQAANRDLAQDPAAWAEAISPVFQRHYRGGDCLEEQRRVGALLHRSMNARFPALPTPRPSPPGARIKVGFVSAHLRQHTIGRLFGGWLQGMDRSRFSLGLYEVGPSGDAHTEALAALCDRRAQVGGDLERAVRILLAEANDVLIFPEIGMHPRPMQLAALRIAPLQAVSWGHPVTTGLPTVDLFLSSAAMAVSPDRAWTTEERVDLPGLSISYRPPPPESGPADRARFGLPAQGTLLLSPQSLFKYRPFADDLHARILAGLPDARLAFLAHSDPAVTARFQQRMAAALRRQGLDPDSRLFVVPRQGHAGWMALLACADLYLDSPGWSGGNTTLEALSLGIPCLAWPGDTMRGRHSLAMVTQLGLPELAPASPEDWVARAIALGQDPAERARLSARIRTGIPGLLADQRGLRALEDLLQQRVDALRAGISPG